jgi:hypothetical protein
MHLLCLYGDYLSSRRRAMYQHISTHLGGISFDFVPVWFQLGVAPDEVTAYTSGLLLLSLLWLFHLLLLLFLVLRLLNIPGMGGKGLHPYAAGLLLAFIYKIRRDDGCGMRTTM